jgi:hypothetical protein
MFVMQAQRVSAGNGRCEFAPVELLGDVQKRTGRTIGNEWISKGQNRSRRKEICQVVRPSSHEKQPP